MPFTALPQDLLDTQRVTVGHVRVGPLHLRCVAVYGWPANYSDALARNDALLQQVISIVGDGGVPTIIGGDFNVPPQSLECWSELQKLGYREAFQLWRERFQTCLPATCRGATRHDTVLLPPQLVELAQSASVLLDCHDFDSHAPLKLSFRLPRCAPCRPVWRKPRSWMELGPEPDRVHTIYQGRAGHVDDCIQDCSSSADLDQAFSLWAHTLECSVDLSLKAQHAESPVNFPATNLPRSARGRCQYREVRQRPLPAACPRARQGDYNPPAEALSLKARARTRQVRRLGTFHRSLKTAIQQNRVQDPAVNFQLANEWAAITRASGYGPGFPTWLLHCAHFHVYYAERISWPFAPPPLDWVSDVQSFVRFDCDAAVRLEARHRAKLAAYSVRLDIADGSSRKGFAALKPRSRPPFAAIPVNEKQTGRLVAQPAPDIGRYAMPEPQAFRPDLPVQLPMDCATVLGTAVSEQHGDLLEVRLDSGKVPSQAGFRQDTEASTAKELDRAFIYYWHPIWTRDRGAARTDEAAWPAFFSNMPAAPASAQNCHLDLLDLDLWRESARTLKVRSATGYCGFAMSELRWLPDGPLWHLVAVVPALLKAWVPTAFRTRHG